VCVLFTKGFKGTTMAGVHALGFNSLISRTAVAKVVLWGGGSPIEASDQKVMEGRESIFERIK
jgi:hypothetical protein